MATVIPVVCRAVDDAAPHAVTVDVDHAVLPRVADADVVIDAANVAPTVIAIIATPDVMHADAAVTLVAKQVHADTHSLRIVQPV